MHHLTIMQMKAYFEYLQHEERSRATLEKYQRDLYAFFVFLPIDKNMDKEAVIAYKKSLISQYAPTSVNSMLAAVNGFLRFADWAECRVKPLKIQRRIFCAKDQELSKTEYLHLLAAAKEKGNRRLYLLMETICSTGIRISELLFITAEAVRRGRAEVHCKGKGRTVFLPNKLCRNLERYLKQEGRATGPVFITSGGRLVDRSNVWKEMKALCEGAGVPPSKVFPHNLRHLFARTYYGLEKDLSRLADLLGHSSVETTRIYTISSGAEHEKQVDLLGLVI